MATSEPQDFIAVGYRNGRIPLRALKPVPGLANVNIHPQAAEQLGELIRLGARQNPPIRFTVSSAYRSYDEQLEARSRYGTGAAPAGYSKHGWGTAVDIKEIYDAVEAARESGQNQYAVQPNRIVRNSNPIYEFLKANGPAYGWVNPVALSDGVGLEEAWHWEYEGWPTPPRNPPSTPPVRTREGEDTPIRSRYAVVPTGILPPTSSITPYIASLDSFHPNIQYTLTKRRVAVNTINTHIPFAKLTSLVNVTNENLIDGVTDAWCPSIGIHGEDVKTFDDIYLPKDNRSIIGYATAYKPISADTTSKQRVPVVVDATAKKKEPPNIPMPGIIEINGERSTAGPMGVRGGLMKVDMKIAAYSVGQVDTLLRYYLRPGTRVVLEWGRRSSDPMEDIKPYDWAQPPGIITEEFSALIKNPEAQSKFIDDYIYANNGNYEIFIGYVVKFDLKYNKNNVYDISVTIHSTQQFEIPTIQTGVKSLCADAISRCTVMDAREYFDSANSWKDNSFHQLMSFQTQTATESEAITLIQERRNTGYRDNFVAIRNPMPGDTGAASKEAGLDEDEYFVSWQFFVDKILNDPERGLISIFPKTTGQSTSPNQLSAQELLKLGVLRSVKTPTTPEELVELKKNLVANEVGYHPDLRSTNPNVMIIYNPKAQANRTEEEQQNYQVLLNAAFITEEERSKFNDTNHITNWIALSSVGPFKNTLSENQSEAGSGFLTQGVWINTKAIKQAFNNADTVSGAISSLLTMMNGATEGYWNLQLYSGDRSHSGLFVVDMGLSKRLEKTTPNTEGTSQPNSDKFPWIDLENEQNESTLKSISDITINRYKQTSTGLINRATNGREKVRPKYIYMFNRGTKQLDDGNHLGSDLLDLNVEFNLPQVIAVQAIAGVGGPAQKSTLQSINIDELNKISLIKNLFTQCNETNACIDEQCGPNLESLSSRFNEAIAQRATLEAQVRRIGVPPVQADASRTVATRRTGTIVSGSQEANQLITNLGLSRQNELTARREFEEADAKRRFSNGMVIDTVRELSSLGTSLQLVEFNTSAMMRKLNLDSMNEQPSEDGYNSDRSRRKAPPAHAFNSSNLTKTVATVTLPGIGGIELFQSFLIDRIPSILDRGFYVVTKVIHKFTVSEGWVTSIEGRFRYRPITEDTTSINSQTSLCGRVETTTETTAGTTVRTGTATAATAAAIAQRGSATSTTPFDVAFPQFSTNSTQRLNTQPTVAPTRTTTPTTTAAPVTTATTTPTTTVAPATTSTTAPQIHTVKAGDTVGKIARQYGVPLQALITLNRARIPASVRRSWQPGPNGQPPATYTILPGMTLLIPLIPTR